jgi:cytoskeletal protein CcmA (bactofilin family)
VIGRIAAVGIPVFTLLISYQISQTSTFVQCASAHASFYVDELNPNFAERITTAFTCASRMVGANPTVLGFGTTPIALMLLFCTFLLLLGSWFKFRFRRDILPSPKPFDRWASALGNSPTERNAVKAPSVIAATVKMSGTFVSDGDFQVDGFIDANIVCSSLVIADCGKVHGHVTANRVIIRGRFKGGINADEIVLCSGSVVEGNLSHKSLEVELGARFNGDCSYFGPSSEPIIRLTSQSAPIVTNKSSTKVEAV